jgi:hypothetical protein
VIVIESLIHWWFDVLLFLIKCLGEMVSCERINIMIGPMAQWSHTVHKSYEHINLMIKALVLYSKCYFFLNHTHIIGDQLLVMNTMVCK